MKIAVIATRHIAQTYFPFVLAIGITIANAAMAQIVRTAIDGLPSGLQVSLRGEFLRCSGTGVIPINAGGIRLVENTFYTFQSPPGGPVGNFRLVAHSRYLGQMTVKPPSASESGCPKDFNSQMKIFLGVLGDEDGFQKTRETKTFFTDHLNSITDVNLTLSAETTSFTEDFSSPTSLRKGTLHRLAVGYSDPFGAASVKTPTLELTQPGSQFGQPVQVSKVKMILTDDNQVCLNVAGNQN